MKSAPAYKILSAVLICILIIAFPACRREDGNRVPDPGAPDNGGKQTKSLLDLSGYACIAGPVSIEGISNDASGLAFCPDTKTLFMVINGRCEIAEINTEGALLRLIQTEGFMDIEAITHVKGTLFYIAEEGRGTICSIRIDKKTDFIDRESSEVYTVDSGLGNKGLEGLTCVKGKNLFYAVKEAYPRVLYRIKLSTGDSGITVSHPWDIEENHNGLRDLSGICFHPGSGNLLILSHKSRALAEVTPAGKKVSSLALSAGNARLSRSIPQAEGIAVDAEDTIYICSEPNLFYVFKKRKD